MKFGKEPSHLLVLFFLPFLCERARTVEDYLFLSAAGKTGKANLNWFGIYRMEEKPFKGYPVYKKLHVSYYLFLQPSGKWALNNKLGGKPVKAQSISNNSTRPPRNDTWQILPNKNERVLHIEHIPQYYSLQYTGNLPEVNEVMKKQNITGTYHLQDADSYKDFIYKKSGQVSLYIKKGENEHWIVTRYNGSGLSTNALLEQEITLDPIPSQILRWSLKIKGSFKPVENLYLTPIGKNIQTHSSDNTTHLDHLVIGSIVCGLIVFVFSITVAAIVMIKKKQKIEEQPVVDANMYYGIPGEDYVYGTTRITDRNLYYVKE